jgi:hypothetical protein
MPVYTMAAEISICREQQRENKSEHNQITAHIKYQLTNISNNPSFSQLDKAAILHLMRLTTRNLYRT